MPTEQQEQAFEKLRKCRDRSEQQKLMEKLRRSEPEWFKRELRSLRDDLGLTPELRFTIALFLCKHLREPSVTLIDLAHDYRLPQDDALKAVRENRGDKRARQVCDAQFFACAPGGPGDVFATVAAICEAYGKVKPVEYYAKLQEWLAWDYRIRNTAFGKAGNGFSELQRKTYRRALFLDRGRPAG